MDFPVDWTEWRSQWNDWRNEHRSQLRPCSYKFPPKNFLADEVLGVWGITGLGAVEFSEVTFRLGPIVFRFVGLTIGEASGHKSGGLASSFDELDTLLGFKEAQ